MKARMTPSDTTPENRKIPTKCLRSMRGSSFQETRARMSMFVVRWDRSPCTKRDSGTHQITRHADVDMSSSSRMSPSWRSAVHIMQNVNAFRAIRIIAAL